MCYYYLLVLNCRFVDTSWNRICIVCYELKWVFFDEIITTLHGWDEEQQKLYILLQFLTFKFNRQRLRFLFCCLKLFKVEQRTTVTNIRKNNVLRRHEQIWNPSKTCFVVALVGWRKIMLPTQTVYAKDVTLSRATAWLWQRCGCSAHGRLL